jgi:Protein of unknown function (DUF998)
MSTNKIFWFGILGVLFFITATVLGGLQFNNYSHLQQLISESYAIGTPNGLCLRIFGFFPSGLFMTLFAFYAIRILPKAKLTTIGFIGFGVFYGIATIVVSVFPCDVGCNKELINPSISQLIHNISGALTYIIVPFCLILIGVTAKKWNNGKAFSTLSVLCGIVALLFFILFMNNLQGGYIGLYQRIIEASILFWVVNAAFYIKRNTQQESI